MTEIDLAIAAFTGLSAFGLMYFGYVRLRAVSPGSSKLRAYLMIVAGIVTLLNLMMYVTAPASA